MLNLAYIVLAILYFAKVIGPLPVIIVGLVTVAVTEMTEALKYYRDRRD